MKKKNYCYYCYYCRDRYSASRRLHYYCRCQPVEWQGRIEACCPQKTTVTEPPLTSLQQTTFLAAVVAALAAVLFARSPSMRGREATASAASLQLSMMTMIMTWMRRVQQCGQQEEGRLMMMTRTTTPLLQPLVPAAATAVLPVHL